jgi:hypothetical protein
MEKHLIQDNPFSNKNLSKIMVEDVDAFFIILSWKEISVPATSAKCIKCSIRRLLRQLSEKGKEQSRPGC